DSTLDYLAEGAYRLYCLSRIRVMVIDSLVLATGNRHKVEEIQSILNDVGIPMLTLNEFPDFQAVNEDGLTCQANAVKKAVATAKFTGHWALADDTGLEVDALQGRPGVYAARYAGEQATYEDNCQKLLQELHGVPSDQRTARFITVVALANPDGETETVEGVLEGIITQEFHGTGGFGYDPVFYVPQLGKTLAEMTFAEKNRISHRAQAVTNAKSLLITHRHSQESGRSAAR
ncbi:MAG TPA: XTP/dITP diphosphatase, partial [Nitrospirales bacterium]|nr:XTP/dITP diphosphatase [Nitrospirales bacterium]